MFFSNLTVTETLTLAARLRLPREYSKAQKKEIVDQVIAELSLNQVGPCGCGTCLRFDPIQGFS